MKLLLFTISLFQIITSCNSQSNSVHKNTNSDINDTVFLIHEIKPDFHHKVFINSDTNSKYYISLGRINLDKFDSASYYAGKDSGFKHFTIKDIARSWCPLYLYKNKYYLYWGSNYNRMISDSALEFRYMDGVYPYIITDYKQVDKTKFQFVVYFDNKLSTITIHLIDTLRQIAIWEDNTVPNRFRYTLMVSTDKLKLFPVIVNECDEEEPDDFNFDTPDYKKLINSK